MAEDVGEKSVKIDLRTRTEKADRVEPSRLISVIPVANADGTLDIIHMFHHD